MNTEIVKASELESKVVQKIFEIRDPEAMPAYRAELRKYHRRRGMRSEGTFKTTLMGFDVEKKTGYQVSVHGETVVVPRPKNPSQRAYVHMTYDRSSGFTSKAQTLGLLADSLYNRDIRPERVNEYAEIMDKGEWHDLLSDPIAITDDGQVVNGQHRLAAVEMIDWQNTPVDPLFLVIWGVAPSEAMYADGSRRTKRDERTIARKLMAPV